MSEVEEASRVVIMLGQLLVPGAQEIARLLARAVALAGRSAGRAGGERLAGAYDDALSRLDGHGSKGWVDVRRLRGRELDFMPMPEAMRRPDLSEFGRLCRSCGVAFGVQEVGGSACLVFDAKDRQRLATLSETLLDAYGIGEAERATIADVEEPTEGFECAGSRWEPVGDETWRAHIASMKAEARANGDWRVQDADGNVATTPQGVPLEGNAAGSDGPAVKAAARQASAYARTVADADLMAADRAAAYQTPERVARGVDADKVRRSVEAVRPKHGEGRPHKATRSASRVVKR